MTSGVLVESGMAIRAVVPVAQIEPLSANRFNTPPTGDPTGHTGHGSS